jgi:SAM-dependent methyltransferase
MAESPGEDPLVVGAWSRVAPGYASYWGQRFRPFVEEALAGFQPGPGPLGVAGCGPGAEAVALADRFPARQVVACDPSGPMLELLRARLALEPRPNIRISQSAASAMPEVLRSAGGVFSSFVLQLLPDRAAALRAWARCLAPGGSAAVLFWPRQPDDDAWGHLGRAIETVAGKPRPDWEGPLRDALPALGLRLDAARDVRHPIHYASPEEAWAQLRDACSVQVLLDRLGEDAARRCEQRWLSDPGLRREGSQWVHAPTARLWVLARS